MKLKMLSDAIESDQHQLGQDHRSNVHLERSDVPADSSQYLLVCEAMMSSMLEGQWRFSLESSDGEFVMEADDVEQGDLNRLTLLAAIRGLEAIEGPSAVTLLSNNRYLIRSLSDSLPRWRSNGFVWEHFGQHIDVQHADLWRRIDRALAIHRVEACLVSSRLVSRGCVEPSREAGGAITRVDAKHPGVRSPHLASHSVPKPKDGLRSWLLGSREPRAEVVQRRFTYHDLLDASAAGQVMGAPAG